MCIQIKKKCFRACYTEGFLNPEDGVSGSVLTPIGHPLVVVGLGHLHRQLRTKVLPSHSEFEVHHIRDFALRDQRDHLCHSHTGGRNWQCSRSDRHLDVVELRQHIIEWLPHRDCLVDGIAIVCDRLQGLGARSPPNDLLLVQGCRCGPIHHA